MVTNHCMFSQCFKALYICTVSGGKRDSENIRTYKLRQSITPHTHYLVGRKWERVEGVLGSRYWRDMRWSLDPSWSSCSHHHGRLEIRNVEWWESTRCRGKLGVRGVLGLRDEEWLGRGGGRGGGRCWFIGSRGWYWSL